MPSPRFTIRVYPLHGPWVLPIANRRRLSLLSPARSLLPHSPCVYLLSSCFRRRLSDGFFFFSLVFVEDLFLRLPFLRTLFLLTVSFLFPHLLPCHDNKPGRPCDPFSQLPSPSARRSFFPPFSRDGAVLTPYLHPIVTTGLLF